MKRTDSILITDRLLSSWIRCKRKAWLDIFESKEMKRWSAHRSLLLDHQYKTLVAFCSQKPGQGAKACNSGIDYVTNLRLRGTSYEGNQLEGRPILIQRIEGKSCFGDFQYRPVIVRQGKRLTQVHKLSLAMWGYLLEEFQQAPVNEGLAISLTNKGLEQEKFILKINLKNHLKDSLTKLNNELAKKDAPQLTFDRKKCSICSWKEFCDQKAYKDGDLSEVSGIGAKRKEILLSVGIKDIRSLAQTNIEELKDKLDSLKNTHGFIADEIISQAKVQVNSSPLRLKTSSAIPELASANGILIYDIESDPDIPHDFLHGFISLKKSKDGILDINKSKYISIISYTDKDKFIGWKKIKETLDYYKDWPVLHYGETELISICRIAKMHAIKEDELNDLKIRFIDVHKRLREHWLLPLNNYSLKTVAKWLEFKWSQENVNGAKALFWWRQYKGLLNNNKKQTSTINKILKYNRDDCLATLTIIKWLIQ